MSNFFTAISIFYAAQRVITIDGFAEAGAVKVGVYLGGEYRFMPQHLLHLAYARAAFQQVGCERMAERVGADIFRYSRILRQLLYYMENHNARKGLAAIVQEQDVLIFAIHRFFLLLFETLYEVIVYIACGDIAHRHQALFIPLPRHTYKAVVEKQVAQPECHQFRNPQPAAVQGFYHSPVPCPEMPRKVDRLHKPAYFPDGKNVGKFAACFWSIGKFGGKVLYAVVYQQKVKKTFYPAQHTSLGGFGYALVVKRHHKGLYMFRFYLCTAFQPELLLHERYHLPEVAHVRLHAITGEFFLEAYIK